MNCAVCGTPRSENEDSCLFCGAKFPEVNSDQEDKNYTTKDVVSFGVEKDDEEFDLDGFLQNDIDLDSILHDIEDVDGSFLEQLSKFDEDITPEEDIETIDTKDFDFSIDDLSEIENMLKEEDFDVEELDLSRETLGEIATSLDEVFTELNLDIGTDEFFTEAELELIEETAEEDFDLTPEEAVEIEDVNSVVEEAVQIEEFNLEPEETVEIEDFNSVVEEAVEIEDVTLEPEATVSPTQEVLFTEEELDFLNSRVEEVHQITVEPTVDSLIDENTKNIDKDFDLSLEDLENIEKDLFGSESDNKAVSLLEQALLSGQDVTSIDVKEVIAEHKQNSAVEEEQDTEDLSVSEAILEALSENLEVEKDGLISLEVYEKISNALTARQNGEILEYIIPNKEDRSDIQIINEVQATVNVLMNDVLSHTDNVNEELLELEGLLIASGKEKEPRVIEDIEDIDNIDDVENLEFVNVDDIDDDDNLVKLSVDDEIQQGIDDLVKNFRETKDSADEEQEDVEQSSEEETAQEKSTDIEEVEKAEVGPSTEVIQEDDEELDELERIDREILLAKKMKDEAEERAAQMDEIDSVLKELDNLILDVIGDIPDPSLKSKIPDGLQSEATTNDEDKHVVEKRLYDKELVQEYEALRLDLELYFPGTQDLDNLSKDIDELLKEDDISEILEIMDSDLGMDFEGFDFEELTDRDISDALIDLREAQDPLDRKRIEERKKKRKARRKKINSIITLGNRVKAYDTALLIICLITAVTLGAAWISTVETQNLTVNMQTKSEQKEVADALWDGLYDIAVKFDNIQVSLEGYVNGEVDTNKLTFELSNLIDETIITRKNFESVDLPTYSEYKYKIDEFLAKRMLLAEEVLQDVTEGKTDSKAIKEFLSLETDMSTFEKTKESFYKQLNLGN